MTDREGQFPVTTLHGYTDEEFRLGYANHKLDQERARLERAVVEAAKAWVKGLNSDPWVPDSVLAERVQDLLQFEQEHDIT